jgi:hypothetical protein
MSEEDAIPLNACVHDKWGLNAPEDMSCTFGLNEKAGMDANHFAKNDTEHDAQSPPQCSAQVWKVGLFA